MAPSQGPSRIKTTIGNNIREARTAADLTQRQLAERLDVDAFQVSRWERGTHRPSDGNMQAIAEALGHELAWFYTDHSKAAA